MAKLQTVPAKLQLIFEKKQSSAYDWLSMFSLPSALLQDPYYADDSENLRNDKSCDYCFQHQRKGLIQIAGNALLSGLITAFVPSVKFSTDSIVTLDMS